MPKPSTALGRVRRIAGRSLIAAGALSGVLFVGTVYFNAGWSNGRFTLYLQNGCAIVASFPPGLGDTGRNWAHNPYIHRNVTEPVRWFEFKLHYRVPASVPVYTTIAPLWTLPSAAVPAGIALLVSGNRPLRWLRQGRCVWCGYDVKGSGAMATCPECGGAGG